MPPPSVVPEIVLMTGVPGPDVLASDTVLPEAGTPFVSDNLTVIVEVLSPSAATEDGKATTVEVPASTGPGTV